MARKSDKQWHVAFANGFWEDGRINLAQKGIVGTLSTWIDGTMRCCPTIPQICAKSGISPKTLYYHLRALEHAGFIEIEHWVDKLRQNRRTFTLTTACQIYIRGWGATHMSKLHAKLIEDSPLSQPAEKPPFKSCWKITHFPIQKPA